MKRKPTPAEIVAIARAQIAVREAMLTGDFKPLVDRFLSWPLPASVCADLCATIHGRTDRIGTNLLTAVEAEAMLRHVLATKAKPLSEGGQALEVSEDATKDAAPKETR